MEASEIGIGLVGASFFSREVTESRRRQKKRGGNVAYVGGGGGPERFWGGFLHICLYQLPFDHIVAIHVKFASCLVLFVSEK